MEQDPLFRQAQEAQDTAKRLVQEAREQIRKVREQLKLPRRWDQPLLWFGSQEE